MKASLINVDQLTAMLGRELNHAMTEAAEPLIQETLKKIEQRLREKLAQRLISFIEHDFSVERMGHDIRIMVKQASK